jgi:glutamyl-tRNA reductase
MIVGSGKMGELAAKHLRRSGAHRILVTNRTRERAEELHPEPRRHDFLRRIDRAVCGRPAR